MEVSQVVLNARKSKEKGKERRGMVAASKGKRETPTSSQSSFQILRV